MDEEELFSLGLLCDLAMEPEESSINGVPRDDLDLLVKDGDLAFIEGPEVLKSALIRRLRTPLGHYGILVGTLDEEGNASLVRDGVEYGADLGKFMSESLTNDWIRDILGAIADTLGEEERIEVTDITIDLLDPARGTIRFNVKYSVKDSGSRDTLELVSGEGFLSIS